MTLEIVQPEGWDPPSGYANGVVVPPGAHLVLVAGQVAWDAHKQLVGPGDFAAQFRQALANVLAVIAAAGGRPQDLASCTVFVKDKRAYLGATRALGAVWRELVGKHYPAMALVEVRDLVEEGALLEIQATAAIVR